MSTRTTCSAMIRLIDEAMDIFDADAPDAAEEFMDCLGTMLSDIKAALEDLRDR